MTRAGIVLLALAALSLPVAAQSAQKVDSERGRGDVEVRRKPAPAPVASIFFCTTRDLQCRTGIIDFGLDEVRDLYVYVAWRNVSGEHIQQLRFVLPDGNAYQVLESRFTTLAKGGSAEVQVAVASRGEPTVVNVVPVAGTHITQHSLAGTWSVEAYLDGKLVARTNLIFHPREQQ